VAGRALVTGMVGLVVLRFLLLNGNASWVIALGYGEND
jgi:hypothetical protein